MIDLQRVWPGWQIEELIGQGAYGKVYRIRREEMGSTYYAALKIMEIPSDDTEVRSLINMGMDNLSIRSYFEKTARNITNEIRIMESLKSAANIVIVEDHYLEEHEDSIGWTILIRMELLETLRNYQKRAGVPDVRETVKIGLDISEALMCCEEKHIIHRDVKPENIFRNDFGTYKLGDFGIARQLENTKSVYSQKGTSMYMAPEVNRGEKYNQTVDIYSLGIMLYQYLNRQRMPFLPVDNNQLLPDDLMEAQARRLAGERFPAPVDADPVLGAIILKACDPDPARRFQHANEFQKALKDWSEGKTVNLNAGADVTSAGAGFENTFKPVNPWENTNTGNTAQNTAQTGTSLPPWQTNAGGPQNTANIMQNQTGTQGTAGSAQNQSAAQAQSGTKKPAVKQPENKGKQKNTVQTAATAANEGGKKKSKLPLIIGAVAAVILIIIIAASAGGGKKTSGTTSSSAKTSSSSSQTASSASQAAASAAEEISEASEEAAEDAAEATGTSASASDVPTEDNGAELYLDSEVLLAGTEGCLRFHVLDGMIIEYGKSLSIASSDPSILSVEADESASKFVMIANKAGTATVTVWGEVDGKEVSASKEVLVVDDTGAGSLALSSDNIELTYFEDTELTATLSGIDEGVANVSALVYHSRELFFNTSGKWNGADLNLSFANLSAGSDEGTIVLLIVDSADKSHVVASAVIPAKETD